MKLYLMQSWVDVKDYYRRHISWPALKIRKRQFRINHPFLDFSIKASLVVGASYLCINAYLEHRHKNHLVEQVGALERMVESGNAVGAKPLASSLYEELHDEDDPRLKALYDDVVFPAYKALKGREPQGQLK